eukprot:9047-Heterococcus_DN1.PRE.4
MQYAARVHALLARQLFYCEQQLMCKSRCTLIKRCATRSCSSPRSARHINATSDIQAYCHHLVVVVVVCSALLPSPPTCKGQRPLTMGPQAAAASNSQFQVPEFYNFPPFFTLQPVLETREKQLKLWSDVVLGYHKARQEYSFAWRDWPLWENNSVLSKVSFKQRVTAIPYDVVFMIVNSNDYALLLSTLAQGVCPNIWSISRRLDETGCIAVMSQLVKTGHAEWQDAAKT